jgi:hypothetical protein
VLAGVAEQCALPDTRLAAKHEGPTPPPSSTGEQRVDPPALGLPANQHARIVRLARVLD